MKYYEYIEVEARRGFARDIFEGTRQIINEMASRGYVYKGFVPKEIYGYGTLRVIDLVFEKEVFE